MVRVQLCTENGTKKTDRIKATTEEVNLKVGVPSPHGMVWYGGTYTQVVAANGNHGNHGPPFVVHVELLLCRTTDWNLKMLQEHRRSNASCHTSNASAGSANGKHPLDQNTLLVNVAPGETVAAVKKSVCLLMQAADILPENSGQRCVHRKKNAISRCRWIMEPKTGLAPRVANVHRHFL